MRVWIDQDCCTGSRGLCVDHCPELFIVLDDGIGYVRDGTPWMTDPDKPSVTVPRRYEQSRHRCCRTLPRRMHLLLEFYRLYPTSAGTRADETNIVDADIVGP